MQRSSRSSTSRRLQSKRLMLFRRGIITLGIAALLIWIALIALSYAKWGKVDQVVIQENPHIELADAQQDIRAVLDTHWFVMGNRDRHWTLPRKKIKQAMLHQANTLRAISLDYKDRALLIEMDIFKPATITCFTDDQCGFTSEDGYVYDHAPDFSAGVYPVLEVNEKAPMYEKGPHKLSQEQRQAMETVLQTQEALGVQVNKLYLDVLDVYFYFDTINGVALPEDAYVVMGKEHMSGYVAYLSDRLKALASKTDFFDRLEKEHNDFRYLDFRFDEKIYMKFGE